MTKVRKAIEKQQQTLSSFALFSAVALAILLVNSKQTHHYFHQITHYQIGLTLGSYHIQHSIKYWCENIFIVFFFFYLGLELKKEILLGDLKNKAILKLIGIAALMGIVVAASCYQVLNYIFDLPYQDGWAIPITTDTAVALGILAILKNKISRAAISFLVGLAIFDDIYTILVIAIYYTDQLQWIYLQGVVFCLALLFIAHRLRIQSYQIYAVLGALLWYMFDKAGLDGAIAGFIVALFTPASTHADEHENLQETKALIEQLESLNEKRVTAEVHDTKHQLMHDIETQVKQSAAPLSRFEKAIALPVALLVLPLYAFINSGIHMKVQDLGTLITQPLFFMIMISLCIAKPIGVYLGCYLAHYFKLGAFPKGLNKLSQKIVALTTGIGFTMSVYITNLALDEPDVIRSVKQSILIASLLSIVMTFVYYYFSRGKHMARSRFE